MIFRLPKWLHNARFVFFSLREEAMSELDKILAYNASFVDAEQYAA